MEQGSLSRFERPKGLKRGYKDGWGFYAALNVGMGVLFSAALFLMPLAHAQSWTTDAEPPSSMVAASTCPDEFSGAWESGSAAITPGHWANVKRSGTGWEFIYSDDRLSMKAIQFTFSGVGRPIWLATQMTPIHASGETWKAKFYKYTSTSSGITSEHKGSVAIRFFPNDPTRLAAVWTWDQLDAAGVGRQTECLGSFNRGGPFDYTASGPTTNSISTPAEGPNGVFQGLWNEAGSINDMPGVTVAIHLNSDGQHKKYFTETHTFTTFDAVGEPVWLTAQKRMNSEFELPPWTQMDLEVAILIPNKLKYPKGVPVDDCLMWQTTAQNCWEYRKVGDYVRKFPNGPNQKGKRGTGKFSFLASPPAHIGGDYDWPGTPQALAGTHFWPANNVETWLYKASDGIGIIVNRQSVHTDANSQGEFWVSWNHPAAEARAWRHDLISNVRVALGAVNNGFIRDYGLPIGSRIQYELWLGEPNAPGAVLQSKTAEVRVYGAIAGADALGGEVVQPPAPASFVEPNADAASDAVGAIAGEFRVDEMGNASYRIPLVVPPGQGGLAPTLALSYTSAGGDGYLGTGMSLTGTSSITACRPGREFGDEGEPTAEPSQFCMDGQRLILWSGHHRELGAQYRTEIDNFTLVQIVSENSTSISGTAGTVKVLEFAAYGKDGTTRRFGGLDGTTITRTLPGVPHAIAWQQTSLKDASGNTINYSYSAINATGERYLQSVSYVGGLVEFSYDASVRTDISYSVLGPARRSVLMKSINIKGLGGTQLRHYSWTYGSSIAGSAFSGFRPRIMSIKECDREGGTCYLPTELTWSDQAIATAEESNGDVSSGYDINAVKTGDFNGDGRTDLVWTNDVKNGNPQRLHIALSRKGSSGSSTALFGLGQTTNLSPALPDTFVPGSMWQVIDLDMDGRDDLIYAFNDTSLNTLIWFKMIAGKGCAWTDTTPCFGSPEVMMELPLSPGVRFPPILSSDGDEVDEDSERARHIPGSSLLADFDGDGLADLVMRTPKREMYVALRNPAAAQHFDDPIRVHIVDVDGVSACNNFITELSFSEEGRGQALDFDGDGRADIRFMTAGADFTCNGLSSGSTPMGTSYFHLEVLRAQGVQYVGGVQKFVFQRYHPFGNIVVNVSGNALANSEVRTVDINGDGLPDLVYNGALSSGWRFRLNGQNTDTCINGCSANNNRTKIQFIDFDGDGKLDFWWPKSNGTYEIYLWKGDSFLGTALSTPFSVLGDEYLRMPGDFDGDGQIDNFAIKLGGGNNGGDWKMQRSLRHHQARAVVSMITDGFGATTKLTYAPMTYSSVYRRDYSAMTREWGNGSYAFDILAPNYVVQYVRSSAPTRDLATEEAIVRYRYAGLKVQAGGRGSLGFRRISTLDLQTQVEIDTWYNQNFPLTGTPYKTWTRKLTNFPVDSSCANTSGPVPDSPNCMVPAFACPVGQSECDGDLDEILIPATILKEGLDNWAFVRQVPSSFSSPQPIDLHAIPEITPVFPKTYFLGKSDSVTRNFDPDNGSLYPSSPTHTEETSIPLYDNYGNPLESTVTQAGGGSQLVTTSRFTYDNFVSSTPTSAVWQLGRLKTADVKKSRTPSFNGAQSIRRSSFTYTSNGLLASEQVEGMTGTFPYGLAPDGNAATVGTYYSYDTAGNRTATYTCSLSMAESACRQISAAKAGSGYVFHPPASSNTVMRYSKTQYDGLMPTPMSSTEAFSGGEDLFQEFTTSTVMSLNAGRDPLTVSGINGAVTQLRYGALGRKYFEYSNTGVTSHTTLEKCATQNCPSSMALAYVATMTTSGAPTAKTFYDKVGRPVIGLKQGFEAGTWIATRTHHDRSGNVAHQSNPYFALNATTGAAAARAGETIVWNTTLHDHLNRVRSVSAPGSGTTTYSYALLSTTTTLPQNKNGLVQTIIETRNGSGEIVQTTDAKGLQVSFFYDAQGNQTKVVRHAVPGETDTCGSEGCITQIVYDQLGRKKSMSDPDMGAWSYEYNDAGELTRQKSPRGTCIVSEYDGRGRVWRRTDYADAACTQSDAESTWQFDTASYGVGNLAEESLKKNGIQRVKRVSSYDPYGRPNNLRTDMEGARSYIQRSTFDRYGRPFQSFFRALIDNQLMVRETGEMLQYNAQGYQFRVRSAFNLPHNPDSGVVYSEVLEINARGQVVKDALRAGAPVVTKREYDTNTGRLRRIEAAGGYLQDLTYDYDLLGNVTYREDKTDLGSIVREEFDYDNLQRLTKSEVKRNGASQGSQLLSFSGDGNILTKTGMAGSYQYGSRPTVCAAASHVVPGPRAASVVNGVSYCYDANGNVRNTYGASGLDRSFTWTAADQVETIASALNDVKVGFDYGPNRERIRRLDYKSATAPSADTLTHFVGGAEIRFTASSNAPGALVEIRRYLGGVLIVQQGTNANYSIRREYMLTDAQGSTYAVLDDYGMRVNADARMSFDPYGRRRSTTDWFTQKPWSDALGENLKKTTRRGYTGHEQVDGVGIIHMGGRIYDPSLGRFLQADPFVQSPGNSQSLNRYTYVFNNPMAYTDPSGYWGRKEQGGLRTVAAIVITIWTGGTAAGLVGKGLYMQAAATAFAGGFAAGAVQSGTLRGATMGGITAMAFVGVANAFPVRGMNIATRQGMAAYGKFALASGITSGILAHVQGGRFGNAFVSAGASALLSPIPEAMTSNPGGQVVIAAVIGGTISDATGGGFANGAITSAFSFAIQTTIGGDGDGGAQPSSESVADTAVYWNEAWVKSGALSVSCTEGECIIQANFSVSHDAHWNSDKVVQWMAEIDQAWNTSHYSFADGMRYTSRVALSSAAPGVQGDLHFGYKNLGFGNFAYVNVGESLILMNTPRLGTAAHEFGHSLGVRHFLNFTGGMMSYADRRSVQLGEIKRIVNGYRFPTTPGYKR